MNDHELTTQAPLLCIGDIHIGRRPEAIASHLSAHNLSPHDVDARSAWEQAIDYALDISARAVILAGDIIDREEHFLEAFQSVERGARRLQDAGIPLIAVAGNHDATLLPRLAEAVPSVKVLGVGGVWESYALEGEGPAVELLGWSFPDSHIQENPLHHPTFQPLLSGSKRRAARIVIVHGDLDNGPSHYAPMQRSELEALDIDAAFLGHIHVPDPLSEARPMGYLGSLTGLDITETNTHGPVEVRVDQGGRIHAQRIPIAPIRWEHLDIDVSSDEPWRIEHLVQHITAEVGAHLQGLRLRNETQAVALRLTLTGHRQIEHWSDTIQNLQEQEQRALYPKGIRAAVIVESYIDATRAALDLTNLRKERTPIGRLAGFLQDGPTDAQLRDARAQMNEAWRKENLSLPDSINVREEILMAAQRTLERMISSREQGGEA